MNSRGTSPTSLIKFVTDEDRHCLVLAIAPHLCLLHSVLQVDVALASFGFLDMSQKTAASVPKSTRSREKRP